MAVVPVPDPPNTYRADTLKANIRFLNVSGQRDMQ